MKNHQLKYALQTKYGSLRAAAKELDINYCRLSEIINGWVRANTNEFIKLSDYHNLIQTSDDSNVFHK